MVIPLFNIDIKITGWDGPFDNSQEEKEMAKKINQARKNYVGLFHVLSSGQLKRGSKKELPTYKGEVDLRVYPLLVNYDLVGGLDRISITKFGRVFFDYIKNKIGTFEANSIHNLENKCGTGNMGCN